MWSRNVSYGSQSARPSATPGCLTVDLPLPSPVFKPSSVSVPHCDEKSTRTCRSFPLLECSSCHLSPGGRQLICDSQPGELVFREDVPGPPFKFLSKALASFDAGFTASRSLCDYVLSGPLFV